MARFAFAITLLVLCALLSSGFAQSSTPGESTKKSVSSAVRFDSSLVLIPVKDMDDLGDPFQRNTARPLTSYLSTNADQFYGFKRYRLSQFDCALQGAGLGMKIGMIGAALGTTFGDWDQNTGWYVAGAAALLGALWGGTLKADDPKWNVQIRWEPPDDDRP